MIQDILAALPWGFLLAISIGPGFFVLLETSITKGFKAAITLDFGIVFSDIVSVNPGFYIYYNKTKLGDYYKFKPNYAIFVRVVLNGLL